MAEKGIADIADSKKIVTELLTKNPQIQAIYAPWDAIAEGVLAATKALGRNDIKVYTMDLGATVSVDMAKKGCIAGIVSDLPYTTGGSLAVLGANSVLGNKTPAFVVVPAIKVNRANLEEMWQRAYHISPPKEVLEALK